MRIYFVCVYPKAYSILLNTIIYIKSPEDKIEIFIFYAPRNIPGPFSGNDITAWLLCVVEE